jgi:hypothetical protein
MEEIPVALQYPEYEKVFEVAQYSKLSKEDKEMYDIELKRRWDKANILATAKAEARGEARGIVTRRELQLRGRFSIFTSESFLFPVKKQYER